MAKRDGFLEFETRCGSEIERINKITSKRHGAKDDEVKPPTDEGKSETK